ncbi:hypothetical protein BVC80_867g4 [Macleaya cordata]|uniref:Uncharacterized protein n=1 Tax=Macleaya cordata TaxID=56857 RepID=A0A200PSZ9_MACCD|nr:hypothetical protein BVC80_867g4 [Macleaya cordata]
MSSTIPSKQRMDAHRLSTEYLEGIDKSYRTWVNHEEGGPLPRRSANIGAPSSSINDYNEDTFPRMVDLVTGTLRRVHPDDIDECLNESIQQTDTEIQDDSLVNSNYKKKLEEAMQPIYPSCQGQHTCNAPSSHFRSVAFIQ